MISITKWMIAPVAAACFMIAGDTPTADAGHGYRVGGLSISIGGQGCYTPSYRSAYRPAYQPIYRPSYHGYHSFHSGYRGSTQLQYRPTQLYRHGNHYDVVPGGWNVRRSGYWHH